MARLKHMPNWNEADDGPDAGEWEQLRDELISLLDQVEGQYGRSVHEGEAHKGVDRRLRDIRARVAAEPASSRHEMALRSVQQAVARFNERGDSEPAGHDNPRDVLHSAVEQIRARQRSLASQPQRPEADFGGLTRAINGIANRLERFENEFRANRGPDQAFESLARAVTGIAARLEGFEAEMRAQRTSPDDLSAITEQMGQLADVVERLANVVGDKSASQRIERHIAALAKIIAQGPRIDFTPLSDRISAEMDGLRQLVATGSRASIEDVTNRLDSLTDMVDKLGLATSRSEANRAAGMQAIEEGVRSIYDRLDAIESNTALAPVDLEALSSEMGAFAAALQNASPDKVLDRLNRFAARIEAMKTGDSSGDIDGLGAEIAALRQAIETTTAPRLQAIENKMNAISSRLDRDSQSDITVPQLEEQVRRLVERMEQTGSQLSGIAKLATRPMEERRAEAEFIAAEVAERTSKVLSELPARPGTAGEPSEEIGAVRQGIDRVDVRLERLESLVDRLARKPQRSPRAQAAADAMPHNPSQEPAPAPARKGASPSDDTAQWRADTDHVDIPENGLEDDSAKMQLGTTGRLASPDPDNLLAEATRQIAEASRRKVFSEAPKFGRADESRPPKPRSTLESEPVAPQPTGHIDLPDAEYAQAAGEPEDKQPQASRNAFIAAARKAAQRNQVEASESRSLIGRAFSRLNARAHSAPERVDEPEAEPIEPVSSTMKTEVAVRLEETDRDAPERAEDDTVDPVIAEEDEPDRESFLSRNRRPILLAATLAAAGMLTLNLVGQRIAQQPATAPQAAKTSETEALPAPIRQVGGQRTSSLDSIRTGSINAVTGAAPTSIDQNVLPTDPTRMQAIDPFGANAPATEIRPASVVGPATGTASLATPVTAPSMPEAKAPAIELPPAQIGPIALRQAAASGDARAQFEIGAIYTEGQVVARDYVLASQWYERAAKQGFAPAQYRLGSLYEHGDGVDKDLAKASHWYELAAEAGNRMAMHNLAALDASGVVGKQDFGAAAKWFEKAAQQGLKDSQFNLGMLYARGLGVPQNLIQSYKWFAIAAETGDKDAAKARDDVARSLDADKMNQAQAEVAAWKPAAIDIKANFAPIGTWSKDFDPGKTIATKEVVQRVQEALGRLGFDAGTADGMMGPKTTEAIRQFEAATGMSESGAVNPRLLAVLGSQPV